MTQGQLHKVSLTQEELQRPDVAWPTIGLAIASVALWLSIACLGAVREWVPLYTFPLSVVAVYAAFTPLHEATHASVSRRYRWLNDLVGWVCSAPFLIVPFPVFRWIHQQHHKHTNDHEDDPDHIETENIFYYLLMVLPSMVLYVVRRHREVPPVALRHAVLHICISTTLLTLAVQQGLGGVVLQYLVLPMLVASSLLQLVFGYIPHRRTEVSRKEDLYGCTGVVDGCFTQGSGASSWWLSCLLCGQNYHAIHHLYPWVPFYSYGKIWRRHQSAFLKAGVPLVTIFQ